MRGSVVLLLALLLPLAGCLGPGAPAPPAGAPERPASFPPIAERPVFTLTGNFTADTAFDPSGGAAVPKREAYAFDHPNATLYWLADVFRPSPATTLFVHVSGTTVYADGNVSRFDDVRSFRGSNFVATYLLGDRAVETRFRPVPVCDGCPPEVEVNGTRLGPGEHVDLRVELEADGTTYSGVLRFENHGTWTVRRVDGCDRFTGCAAIPAPGPA